MTDEQEQARLNLRELPEKWRDEMVLAADREQQIRNSTLEKCATELEQAIEETEE